MSQLEFDGEENKQSFESRMILGAPDNPKMVKLLMRTGIFKDERKAGNFLILLSIVFFVIGGILFYSATRGPQVISPRYIEDLDPSVVNNPAYINLPHKQ